MNPSTLKYSVGLVGFLRHETSPSCEPTRTPVGFPENASNLDCKPDQKPDQLPDISAVGTADRQAKRGCDFDLTVPGHTESLPTREPSHSNSQRTSSTVPDSRHPLIEPAVRSKLEAIEVEARSKGWAPELLWNANFWDLPRGLAAVLDHDDEIVEVTSEYVTILKTKRDLLRFRRHNA
jgi:hypothetical protein